MRSRNIHLTCLILFLATLGIATFLYRYEVLDVPLTPGKVISSWTVEAHLKFNADGGPVKASFMIPNSPPFYAVLNEYFVSHNYGATTSKSGFNRETTWSIRRAHGSQSLYYRVIFHPVDTEQVLLGKPKVVEKKELSEAQKSAVEAISAEVRKTSADIQTFSQETIKLLNNDKESNAQILVGEGKDLNKVAQAANLVLNQAKISSQLVLGLKLKTQSKADFESFLAVYNGKKWIYLNLKDGSIGLPHNFLVWQYGGSDIYSLKGGSKPQFSISISPTPVSALKIAKIRGTQADSKLIKFSLLQLPISVQETYKILLTVPIGAFIILLLRNFVGLVTFGTFMPVLIALAFRETHVVWGLLMFVTIVSVGLLVRFYLDQLKLLLVPRLAVILTVVILLMVMISILCGHLGLDNGLSVALFPMVILTMTIERMCITWDERGAAEAVKSGVGSLFAAVVVYSVMHLSEVEYLVFAFPELLFVLMALILWFGQYRGYRLMELVRFKALTKE